MGYLLVMDGHEEDFWPETLILAIGSLLEIISIGVYSTLCDNTVQVKGFGEMEYKNGSKNNFVATQVTR
jgi:hypothetical protein